jgi:hypothetical protein
VLTPPQTARPCPSCVRSAGGNRRVGAAALSIISRIVRYRRVWNDRMGHALRCCSSSKVISPSCALGVYGGSALCVAVHFSFLSP